MSAAPPRRRPYVLAPLGPTQPWQALLLLPTRYQDMTQPAQGVHAFADEHERRPMELEVLTAPVERWPSAGSRGPRRPRTVMQVRTPAGEEVQATIFGDTRGQRDAWTPGARRSCLVSCSWWNDRPSLVVHADLDPDAVGKVHPLYAGKPRTLTPEQVREQVIDQLPRRLGQAATHLREQITAIGPEAEVLCDMGADGWSLEQLIEQAHAPVSLAHGEYANEVLRRLGALVALQQLARGPRAPAPPLSLATREGRLAALPYRPTDDQARAIEDIAQTMRRPEQTLTLLAGGLGTGKTLVALVLAAAAHDAGHRVVIMAPTSRLCAQIAAEARALFPEVPLALVTADTAETAPPDTRWWIGTSALLFRNLPPPDLLVLDEQHKFSRAQREQLVGPHTHVLEMTATPIPRTQALVQFGGLRVVRLRQTHAPKTFITTLYEGPQALRGYYATIMPALRSGDRLLVVYPRRQGAEEGAPGAMPGADRYAVDRAFERWDSLFPGKVACLTSDDDDATKERVLQAFEAGHTPILVCTTIVECGLTLPSLHRIAIVCPERYGLVTLAQLRGRTARHGGEGYCDLLCPESISPTARARLQTFERVTDDFELAEMDWQARGAGDLSADSERQSGADGTCLFGVRLSPHLLTQAVPVFEKYAGVKGDAGRGRECEGVTPE